MAGLEGDSLNRALGILEDWDKYLKYNVSDFERPTDNVRIDPGGNVWVENPDGSWTNEGPAGHYTGSGSPLGQKGKDRDKPWGN